MFYVGQKVVCVDTKPLQGYDFPQIEKPSLNMIYTIAALAINDDNDPVCQLVELKRDNAQIINNSWYAWYGQFRFRPLTERKNDGEAFVRKLKEDCIPKTVEVV